jgi:sigma-B regulation protein RsbU (phosphoserine phosphatase)
MDSAEKAQASRRRETSISFSLVDPILDELRKVVDFDRASIMLLVGDTLEILAASGLTEKRKERGFKLSELEGARHAIENKTAVVISDTLDDNRWSPSVMEKPLSRSWIGVPMILRERVIGVLNLDKLEPHFYDQTDLGLVSAFANQAAIAIENARLFEQQGKLAQKLLGLYALSQRINALLDTAQVLEELIEQIHTIFGYDFITIFLLDEWANELYIVAQLGYDQERLPLSGRLRVGLDGICGYVAATGEVAVVPDVCQAPFYLAAHPDIQSELAIPLTVRERIVGVVNVESDQISAFKEDDITLLSALAGQMAVALENARLYQQTQQQLGELAQETARLRVVNQVSTLISSTLDLQQIMQIVVDQLVELTDADQCRLIIFDYEAGYGRVWAEHTPTENVEEVRLPIEGNPSIESLIENKEPLVIYDVATDHRMDAVRDTLTGLDVKSMLILPLIVKDQVIGSFGIDAIEKQRSFSSKEIETCRIIANQAAIAIENARLFQERERRIAELAVLNDVGRAISSVVPLNELLEMIREQASRVVDTTNLYIALYDPLKNTVEFPLLYEYGKPVYIPPREFSQRLTEYVIRSRAPLLIRGDTRDFCREYGIEHGGTPAKSWLGVPLIAGDRVIGVMAIQDYEREGVYDEDHQRILSTLAAQAAIALENARLYEKERRRAAQLAVINEVGRQITSILDQQELLFRVSRLLRQTLGYHQVHIALVEGGDLVFYTWSVSGEKPKERLRLKISQEGVVGWVAATGEPLIVPDVRLEPRYRSFDLWTRTRSEIALPLKVGYEILGVLNVESEELAAFDEEAAAILQSLASQIAIALSNARLYQESVTRVEQELTIARQIQQNLFPQVLPRIPGLEVAAICWPARETGGDFYEFLELDKQRLGIIVGDVSGKSIPAAMLMAVARSTARSEGRDHPSPAKVLCEVNRLLYADVPEGSFVAMSYAVIDAIAGRLTISNGGQLSPLWCTDGNSWRYLEAPGNCLPLGIQPENDYQEVEVKLAPGDCIVFYTDGVVEAMNQQRELYGFQRLEQLLRRHADRPPRTILDKILKDVAAFGGEGGLQDDLTLVITRWQGPTT